MGNENENRVFGALEAGDPPTIAGYRISAKLGEGGMGKVYLSYTPGGRPVAIKVIRPDFAGDPEFRRRFKQEVRAAQRVQGLYTAPVIDSDTDGNSPWLATAYVPGPSVHAAVCEHGRLPAPAVLLMVAGIAEALQVIHGAGIVHRDLKPSNVLLSADGPRVIDFGIARATDATSLTGSGAPIGTAAFMSPEQASGKSCGPASDVFALGQVAAYAAIGNPAFGEGASHAMLYRIVHEEPDLTGLPSELRDLVGRCLAKDPAGRPSLTEIIDLCRAASPHTQLRRSDDWLPAAVTADIGRREAAPAPPYSPPPPVTAPSGVGPEPTRLDGPPLHAAPTTMGDGPRPGPAAYPPGSAAYPSGSAVHPPGSAAYPPGSMYPPGIAAPPIPTPQPRKNRAGLVVAVVLVAAVVGIVGGVLLKYGDGGTVADDEKKSTDQVSEGPSPTGTPSGGENSLADPKPTDTKPAEPKPAEYKAVNITDGYTVSLKDDPPRPAKGDVFYEGDFGYRFTSFLDPAAVATNQTDNTMTLVDPGQTGSLASCLADTRYTTSVEADKLSKGSQICIQTGAGHIGLVTVRGFAPEDAQSHYVTVDITVWRNANPS